MVQKAKPRARRVAGRVVSILPNLFDALIAQCIVDLERAEQAGTLGEPEKKLLHTLRVSRLEYRRAVSKS